MSDKGAKLALLTSACGNCCKILFLHFLVLSSWLSHARSQGLSDRDANRGGDEVRAGGSQHMIPALS